MKSKTLKGLPVNKQHPCHSGDIPRLNRIAGQVEGVKKMIDEGRYCPDILMQLRAIRSAIKNVEANILDRHLEHCVHDAVNSGNTKQQKQKLDEIKELFKRYEQ